MAKPALDKADIHFREPVKSINARSRHSGGDQQVEVTTSAGKKYTFDEVVTTSPLGWLKQNKNAFSPPLPKRLAEAIDNISYGQLEKVYVHFPTAFWQVMSNNAPKEEQKKGAISQHITPFTQFFSPNYVQHPPTPFWNQECLSLADLPPDCAHPTLLFYLYGPCATRLISQIAPLPHTSPEYYHILTDFLQPYYSRMPNYDSASQNCKPTSFLATKWQADTWAGNGSYSNFQVGLEEGDRDIEIMREGMGIERGVWLAGEHTAPIVGLGTTSGAYWSGEEVAKRICDYTSNRKSAPGPL